MLVPKGAFKMGCSAADLGGDSTRVPQVDVTLSGFWMGKYEVAQKEYLQVMD